MVVPDGGTGKDAPTYNGRTGGRFAAEWLLGALAGLPPGIGAPAALGAFSGAPASCGHRRGGHNPANPPDATMGVYSAVRREGWRFDDINLRLGAVCPEPPAQPTDAITTAFRAALLEAYLAGGASQESLMADDPSWSALLPLLARQGVFANLPAPHPLGYGVVNAAIVLAHHRQVYLVPAGTEVVLASDGYLSAEGELAQSEAVLADVLAADLLLIRRYQGFRPAHAGGSFDDRCWVRFTTDVVAAVESTGLPLRAVGR